MLELEDMTLSQILWIEENIEKVDEKIIYHLSIYLSINLIYLSKEGVNMSEGRAEGEREA